MYSELICSYEASGTQTTISGRIENICQAVDKIHVVGDIVVSTKFRSINASKLKLPVHNMQD